MQLATGPSFLRGWIKSWWHDWKKMFLNRKKSRKSLTDRFRPNRTGGSNLFVAGDTDILFLSSETFAPWLMWSQAGWRTLVEASRGESPSFDPLTRFLRHRQPLQRQRWVIMQVVYWFWLLLLACKNCSVILNTRFKYFKVLCLRS